MMLDANFSLELQGLLWCEAMDVATGLANITAMTSKDICASEGFNGVKPLIYENLQPFGRVGTSRNVPRSVRSLPRIVRSAFVSVTPRITWQMYTECATLKRKVLSSCMI